jgi:hypothetical protein
MKKLQKFTLVLTIVVVMGLIFPTQVLAASTEDDRIIFGESYTLESGRTLNGDLIVIGGIVNVEVDATVNGNVVVIGGLVTIDGTVTGDLTALGGTVNLEEDALIQGDLISPASYINRDPGAVVQGDQIENWETPLRDLDLPFFTPGTSIRTPRVQVLTIANRIGRWIALSLILTGLGALLLLIMPKSTDVMTAALEAQPWQLLGFGALTALVMLFGSVILAITICLIPIVILLGLAFALAVLVGWLALGYELGKRISQSLFKTTWHPVLSSAVGNLLLYLIASGLDLIPCLGGFLVLVTMLFGLGMVVVTLFGTNPYPRGSGINSEKPEVLFDGKESEWEKEAIVEERALIPDEVTTSDHPIEDLGLSDRINKTLKDAGLTRIEDVLEHLKNGGETLLNISGFGMKSLQELKEALQRSGYQIPGSQE